MPTFLPRTRYSHTFDARAIKTSTPLHGSPPHYMLPGQKRRLLRVHYLGRPGPVLKYS
jgi:hypothetical protein